MITKLFDNADWDSILCQPTGSNPIGWLARYRTPDQVAHWDATQYHFQSKNKPLPPMVGAMKNDRERSRRFLKIGVAVMRSDHCHREMKEYLVLKDKIYRCHREMKEYLVLKDKIYRCHREMEEYLVLKDKIVIVRT